MEFKKILKLELGDYTAFNFFTLRKLFIFVPILGFGLAFLLFNDPERRLIEVVIIALVMAILSSLVFFYSINNSVKKTYRTSRFLQLPQEVILNDTGVHTSGEFGTTNILWQDISKVSETKNAIYFYVQKTQAINIPKRLITEEEAVTIHALIMKNLSSGKTALGESY